MTRRVALRVSPAAEEETKQAARWYEQQRFGLGVEFLAAVDTAMQRIARNPLTFPRLETLPEENNVHRFLLERFPYVTIYEALSHEVRVLAVVRSKRRPHYWRHSKNDG
jgi:toxin ParE1/3/4